MSVLQQLLDSVASLSVQKVDPAASETASLLAETPAPPTAGEAASSIQRFIAPIAGTLIGLFSLKYLFGKDQSLAGFIGFMLLAVLSFVLLWDGPHIVMLLGRTIQSWVSG